MLNYPDLPHSKTHTAWSYIRRLPDDTFGIALYIVVCILFAILAAAHYARWMVNR
jgi:hypothetical protein